MKKNVRHYSKISQVDGVGRSDHCSGSYDLWYGEPNILLNREHYWPCPADLTVPVWPYYFIENSRQDRQWYRHFNHTGLSITLVLAGRIEYAEDQRSFIVGAGEVMILQPGCSDRMVNADDTASSKLVVIFEGAAKYFFARLFGFYSSGKIQVKNPAVIEKKMRRIGALLESCKAGTEFELAELGISLWIELAHQRKKSSFPPLLEELLAKLQKRNFILAPDESLSSLTGVSESTILRLFRLHIGCPPHLFLLRKRLEYAASLLRSGVSVKEAAEQSGFAESGYFSRCFKAQFGTQPSAFCRNDSSNAALSSTPLPSGTSNRQ